MSIKIAGLVDCFDIPELGPLTKHRSVASTSFLGRYAYIDFPLSNFLNSDIINIGILCQNHIRSLSHHVGNGRSWISNTKLGDLQVLYDEPNVANPAYNTDVADLVENKVFLRDVHPDYIVLVQPNFVYEADFEKLVEDHIASGSRVSMLYTHVAKGLSNTYLGARKLSLNMKGKVKAMEVNVGQEDAGDISLGTIILDYPMLESLIEYAQGTSSFFNLFDCLTYLAPTGLIRAVEFKGYVRSFDSLPHYLKYSLELLDRKVFDSLFAPDWPIHTRTYDTPPVRYAVGSEVSNSYLANGCLIKGSVKNSILGRNVTIEAGAVVENSVIGNDVVISQGAHLDHVVCDRDVKVLHVTSLEGSEEAPLYVARGDIV
ncbi:MAG: glucose-1-phosphate adenylyltransferase subunit GlgD [Eubacteriales bacterium]|jgi:glucose-1-phosphate adenylyltransferase|nr:glucose-1-phosphate adenylyltransferase subunit GlgD [Eubacteriales bacterium]